MEWMSCFGTLDSSFDPVANLSQKINHLLEPSHLYHQYNEIFQGIISELKISPGLSEYIRFAQDHEIGLAIASGGKKDFVTSQLKRLNLIDQFDCICCFEDTGRSKPDPSLYQYVLQKMGIDPDESIAFEDSPLGVKAAQTAKIFCVGILNPINIHLPSFSANMIIKSFTDIPPSLLVSKILDNQ
jgi:putative hydrolase of the HAD superfamily